MKDDLLQGEALPQDAEIDKKLIFVIEDSGVIQTYLKKILGFAQYRVMVANNGKEGIELLKKSSKRPDLILLDLDMPVMDGLDCIKGIRALSDEKAKTPVIAFTGNAQELSPKEISDLTFAGLLIKPVSSNKLIDTIEENLPKDSIASTS